MHADAIAVRAINAAGECNFSSWIVDGARIKRGRFEVRTREQPWDRDKAWIGVRDWIGMLYAADDFEIALKGAFTLRGNRFDPWSKNTPSKIGGPEEVAQVPNPRSETVEPKSRV